MKKPELTFLFSVGKNDEYIFASDEKTNELYLNGKRIVTAVDFKIGEKILAWIVALSVFVQAAMSVLSYFTG